MEVRSKIFADGQLPLRALPGIKEGPSSLAVDNIQQLLALVALPRLVTGLL